MSPLSRIALLLVLFVLLGLYVGAQPGESEQENKISLPAAPGMPAWFSVMIDRDHHRYGVDGWSPEHTIVTTSAAPTVLHVGNEWIITFAPIP